MEGDFMSIKRSLMFFTLQYISSIYPPKIVINQSLVINYSFVIREKNSMPFSTEK